MFNLQFLVVSELEMGGIFKKQCKLQQRERSCFFLGGCGWERIFYIITLITAAGGAMGVGRNYKVYYVIIAWEWFLCAFSVCFLDWV